MSSGITNTDSMMYVGQKPWHGMGTELPSLATAAEAVKAAGLTWGVAKVPDIVKLTPAEMKKYGIESKEILPQEGTHRIIRCDNGQILGTVGNRYEPLQNEKAFELFDQLTADPNGPKYVTAGSLWGGQQIWILAKLQKEMRIVKDDMVEKYVLLSHYHTGLGSIQVQETPIRVVCNNTLSAALKGGEQKFKMRHIGGLDRYKSKIQDLLGIITVNFDEMEKAFMFLQKREVTQAEMDSVVAKLLPTWDENGKQVDFENEEKVSGKTSARRAKVHELIASGKGTDLKGVRGTMWGVYNGFTEFVDHYRSIGETQYASATEQRFYNLVQGSGADLKKSALEICLASAK